MAMTGKQLRDSILQMAVQGKLVEQDPDDEPASALLERVREERRELVEKGQAKAPKNGDSVIFVGADGQHYEVRINAKGKRSEPICIEDEMPFDIPDGWEWTRLGDVGAWGSGCTPNKSNRLYHQDGTIPWLMTGDLNDGLVTGTSKFVTEKALAETSLEIKPKGSVLVAMYGATIGKLGVLDIPATTNQACCACVPYEPKMRWYIFYFLSAWKERFRHQGEGSAQPNISKQKIVDTLVPVPPLSEQARIVAKLDELLPMVDHYGDMEAERVELDEKLPSRLRESLLQAAVQGRLTEQDPNDEPASFLLDRVREERAELVKNGELKAPKGVESVIWQAGDGRWMETRAGKGKKPDTTEDISKEVPFDLPKGWAWARVSSVGTIVGGGTPKTGVPGYWTSQDRGIPWLTPADMKNIPTPEVQHGERFITEAALSSSSATLMPAGTVLMSSRAPIGYMGIAANPLCTNQGFKSVVPYDMAMTQWLYWAILSRMEDIKGRASGTTFKEISAKEFGKTLVPIAPLAEQERIIARLDELLPMVDAIAESAG